MLATLHDAPSRKALQDAIRAFEKDYPALGAKALPSAQNPNNANLRGMRLSAHTFTSFTHTYLRSFEKD